MNLLSNVNESELEIFLPSYFLYILLLLVLFSHLIEMRLDN